MQAQSCLTRSSSSSLDLADEHKLVISELMHGHELMAQLRAVALLALRGQGEAEATAAFILQVSRAFTVCHSIMSSPARAPDEHEVVIHELTWGNELTAQLRVEALRALRGRGQAEATAAFILQEMSRALNVCLSIMSSPTRALPQHPPSSQLPPKMGIPSTPGLAFRRSQEDSIPREQRRTSSPHFDGYQWRKYGQKRITKTQFPRCYFKCSFHRDRNCRATKQVQQCSNDDPPQYVVMYFNEHTCDATASEPAAAAGNSGMLDDLSGLAPQIGQGARALEDEGGLQEEHERRLLVSSLTSVLEGQHKFQQSSSASSRTTAAITVNMGHEQKQPLQAHKRKAPEAVDVAELYVMDYDVASP